MTTPELFLFLSIWGALWTAAALTPARKLFFFVVPYFFMSWLTAELAAYHIVWQMVATLVFAAFGAFNEWQGVLGLAITFLSWGGLLLCMRYSSRAEGIYEAALLDGLGHGSVPTMRHRSSAGASAENAERPWLEAPHDLGELDARQLARPFSTKRQDVEYLSDIPYGDLGKRNLLDIYRPKSHPTGAPILVQIHGGGWTIGHKAEQALPLMNYMASRGWICVAPNYRLSPKATYPDHLIDVKRAVAWVREHAHEYGGDPDFICVTGGSAGGHLTALMGLTAGRKQFQPGFEDADTSVAAAVPFYGVYDFLERHGARGFMSMRPFLERYVMKCSPEAGRERWLDASPLEFVDENAPPFFVIHGTHDCLAFIEDAETFVDRLREVSRNPVVYAELPGAQHAFDIFHSVRTGYTMRAIARFLETVYSQYTAA